MSNAFQDSNCSSCAPTRTSTRRCTPPDAADGTGPGYSTHCPSLSYRAEDKGAAPVPREDKNPEWWHPVEIPQARDLPARSEAVLEAIYAAFGIGWDDRVGADQRGRDRAEEATWLAQVLVPLMPGEAEACRLSGCTAKRGAWHEGV